MALTYRTAGAWGAGKGSNLNAAEVDNNFKTLLDLITDLVDHPVEGVSISGFEVTDDTFIVHLSDATSLGPFALPQRANFVWSNDWMPDVHYDLYDVFRVVGQGIYLVVSPSGYTQSGDFDPLVTDTDGNPFLQLMLADTSTGRLTTLMKTAPFTLVAEESGAYIRVSVAATTDPVQVTVPLEADSGIPLGTTFVLRQHGAAKIEFAPADTSIVINTPETLRSRKQHSTVTIVYLGSDEWELDGGLELA